MDKRKSDASGDSSQPAKRSHLEKPLLYSYFRSSCTWRVRIVLALKGIDYEYRAIHLLNNDQNSDEYIKINPSREVPSLLIDGEELAQSVAIMEYLEETRPQVPVLPKSPGDRAKVRQIVQIICADTQPIQNLRVLNYVGEKKQEWANYWITWNFEALEKVLQGCSGKYCFGDTATMADACLVPQVYNARRFNVDISKFPTIARIDATLSELEAFKKAHPSAQPDCPEDLKGK